MELAKKFRLQYEYYRENPRIWAIPLGGIMLVGFLAPLYISKIRYASFQDTRCVTILSPIDSGYYRRTGGHHYAYVDIDGNKVTVSMPTSVPIKIGLAAEVRANAVNGYEFVKYLPGNNCGT